MVHYNKCEQQKVDKKWIAVAKAKKELLSSVCCIQANETLTVPYWESEREEE